ncbi:hypothetical protein PYW08_000758 [Mythimna loreyi]|uniref:Uncharacterized protein n=1 Tax=Mythimna loreyi TaxID=667449 RepID=A0ACC2R0K3_9NEOP|nr:hypothetical protein PYW08_000758 [Mythimna loreyi]
MPKPRKSRSQSRRSDNRSHKRLRREESCSRRSKDSQSRTRSSRRRTRTPSRPRSRLRHHSRSCIRTRERSFSRPDSRNRHGSQSRSPKHNKKERRSTKSHENLNNTLDAIMNRLETIESNFTSTSITASEQSSAQTIVDAIQAIVPGRSRNYYVSNFDPSLHDIDAWCDEVDRAQVSNNWDDKECLSRVANCLKGDAKAWLNEWVCTDRSWSSFKREFKPLCPRKLDYVNILFETMNNTSDKYPSYAEYARRALLRLRIVKGLSEDLMTLIVIRGITDPQVRAAAANVDLSSENCFLFINLSEAKL